MDNQQAIMNKAESKKDGVYKFRGVAYKVINGHAVYFAANEQVLQMYCGFNAVIGRYEHSLNQANAVKALKLIK
tara:strand:- start:43 stop:264 length:222 start_codon:yes stop_codon:yes gene_type:complete